MENKKGIWEDLSKVISSGKPEFQLFVQHLHNLGQLNIGVNMKTLDLELLKNIIGDIEKVFKELQEHFWHLHAIESTHHIGSLSGPLWTYQGDPIALHRWVHRIHALSTAPIWGESSLQKIAVWQWISRKKPA